MKVSQCCQLSDFLASFSDFSNDVKLNECNASKYYILFIDALFRNIFSKLRNGGGVFSVPTKAETKLTPLLSMSQ